MNTLRVLWRSTVGKKAVMALTGVVLFVWLLLHISGNLLVFLGPSVIDGYAAALHARPWLLWPMRIGLLAAVGLHVTAAVQLARRARKARGQRRRMRLEVATLGARTMRWGGALLAAFIVFHLLHLTTGTLHPQFVAGGPHHNMVSGLRVPAVAALYLLAVTAVALHVSHGLWSARRSLGWKSPAHAPPRRLFSISLAIVLGVGFAVIPLAVLSGLLR
jgi:succinate dehydrogenase / fumarate reductase, cytochrome b subunit